MLLQVQVCPHLVCGRGGGFQILQPDAPFISLLYQERPLRHPIVFVPSTLKPVFDQVEDLSKPVVEEVGAFSYSFLISKIGNTE